MSTTTTAPEAPATTPTPAATPAKTTEMSGLITVDDRGIARVAGSRSSVKLIVQDVRNGLTPETIVATYPHLSLAQVHAALAFYHLHQAEIDEQMRRDTEAVERAMAEAKASGRQLTREMLLARTAKLDPAATP
jgi:uncharacterized protein (DUF433 family)